MFKKGEESEGSRTGWFFIESQDEQILRISSYGKLVAVLTIAGQLNSEANQIRRVDSKATVSWCR